MMWFHQWDTSELNCLGQWAKVQLLCKNVYYIRLQSLSSSQIINAQELTEDFLHHPQKLSEMHAMVFPATIESNEP